MCLCLRVLIAFLFCVRVLGETKHCLRKAFTAAGVIASIVIRAPKKPRFSNVAVVSLSTTAVGMRRRAVFRVSRAHCLLCRTCQKADWANHKPTCKEIAAEFTTAERKLLREVGGLVVHPSVRLWVMLAFSSLCADSATTLCEIR